MADKPAVQAPIDNIPLSEIGSAVAPFVYFDGAANFGFNAGVANITLEALSYTSVSGKIITQRVVVAQIRTSAAGLASLKSAIEGIELLANPAQGNGKN